MAPKVGNQFHFNHSKLSKEEIKFSPCLLNKETKAIIDKISKADGNHTIATNVVFCTTGAMLARENIHYLSELCNKLEDLYGIRNKDPRKK